MDYIESRLKILDFQKKSENLLHHHLSTTQAKKLRSAVGGLRWIADQTRPDASFACLVLNCNQLNPTWRDVKIYNAAVNAIKNNPYDLVMRKLETTKWKVSVFSDASHGNLPPDGTGTGGGYIIFLSNGYIKGEKNRCNVLTWKCAKLRKACTSTTEAETIQLNDAILETEMIKEI